MVLTAYAVDPLLAQLDAEQRAAAVLPDGPAQIIAPAGSGKTTTLIARLGVLLGRGVDPARILVVTFNRDAAVELTTRIAAKLAPLAPSATEIEVRTLHALARRVLLDAGFGVRPLADRLPLLRAARRRCAVGRADEARPLPEAAELDAMLAAWKIEGTLPPREAQAVLAEYAALLAARGLIDFDDLLVRARNLLETDPEVGARWQARFGHVLVDEFQDVDAVQLGLVRLLAEPERNLFVVGDDDQTLVRSLPDGGSAPSVQPIANASRSKETSDMVLHAIAHGSASSDYPEWWAEDATPTDPCFAIYAGISDVGEDDAKNQRTPGVERQVEDCEFAARRQDAKRIRYYRDGGSTFEEGSTLAVFEALLADISAGEIQEVIAWKIERFTRQPNDIERLLRSCV